MLLKLSRTLPCTAALAAILGAIPALAYVSDDVEYDIACNDEGYVLTSKHPVTRMVPTPVDAEAVIGIETIYFGRSCDAFHKDFGKGKWCQANGGFRAEFSNRTFGFARQELSCRGAEVVEADCGCQ